MGLLLGDIVVGAHGPSLMMGGLVNRVSHPAHMMRGPMHAAVLSRRRCRHQNLDGVPPDQNGSAQGSRGDES